MHDNQPVLMWNLFCCPNYLNCWNLYDFTVYRERQSTLCSLLKTSKRTMRFRRIGKLDLKKSLLLIVIAYLFAGLGMILWSGLVVPTFTKTRLIVDKESLSIDNLFLQDSLSVTRQAVSVKGKYSVKIRPPAYNFSFFSPSVKVDQETANFWVRNSNASCSGRIVGYANEFVKLTDVLVDPILSHGRDGGENLTSVLNQAEEEEYLTFDPGFFKIKCKSIPPYEFSKNNHLNSWWSSLQGVSKLKANPDAAVETCFTIAITRYEYVNFYHTMTDFYNVFLMLIIFKQQPHNVRILWIDAHPIGSLDVVWNKLFTGYTRLKTIKRPVMFRQLVWGIIGYNSPLLQFDHPTLPFVEEFREFFLRKYNQSLTKKLDCHGLNVLFIWRRDYVAHPRNPKGLVSRKIQNEDELLINARKLLAGDKHNVRGVQVDLYSMEQQLRWISDTDILVGMHGAGLTHALFLPKHAGVIEFYPTYWSDTNAHFRSIARWRKLKYMKWQNSDTNNELDNCYTRIPVNIAVDMLKEMKQQLCPKK